MIHFHYEPGSVQDPEELERLERCVRLAEHRVEDAHRRVRIYEHRKDACVRCYADHLVLLWDARHRLSASIVGAALCAGVFIAALLVMP